MTVQRLGVMGGAFDPPHVGHLRPALEVAELLRLDRVLFVPAGGHPFKARAGITSVEHRLAMTRLAVAEEPRFAVSELETSRPGLSYTVETLENLGRMAPETELFLLLGSDLLGELHLWREWRRLPELAHLVLMGRPGYEILDPALPATALLAPRRVESLELLSRKSFNGHGVGLASVTRLAVSSTELRARLRQGLSVRWLVPDEVVRYMESNGLYREQGG